MGRSVAAKPQLTSREDQESDCWMALESRVSRARDFGRTEGKDTPGTFQLAAGVRGAAG